MVERDEIPLQILGPTANSVEVFNTKSAGRGLRACKKAGKGEQLFWEPVLVVGRASGNHVGNRLICINCNKILGFDAAISACGSCKQVLCCDTCRTKKPDYHKLECSIMQTFGSRIQLQHCPHFVSLIRAIVIKQKDAKTWKKLQCLQKTLPNAKHRKAVMETAQNALFYLKPHFPDETVDTLAEILAIFDCNSFRMDENGSRGVYGLTSLINHACNANSRVVFTEENNVLVLAKHDIEVNEEITISYVQPLLSTLRRQENLERNKFFTCQCPRCQDPSEFGTFLGSPLCPKCKDYLLPQSRELFECRNCSFGTSGTKVRRLEEAVEEKIAKVTSVSQGNALLSTLRAKLAPNHFLILNLKMKVVDLSSKGHEEQQALRYVTDRIEILDQVEQGAESRLLGFLNYRKFCLLRRMSEADLTCGSSCSELNDCWQTAKRLLINDKKCPPDLKNPVQYN